MKANEATLQKIRDLFEPGKLSDDLAEEVWAAIFGEADADLALAFLGAMDAHTPRDQPCADVLFPLMVAAFKRTDAHSDAMGAHVKRLLTSPKRKGEMSR